MLSSGRLFPKNQNSFCGPYDPREGQKKKSFFSKKKTIHQQGQCRRIFFCVERGRPLTFQTSKTGHTVNNFGEKQPPSSALLPSALGVCM
jgi:hypothetical protein